MARQFGGLGAQGSFMAAGDRYATQRRAGAQEGALMEDWSGFLAAGQPAA
jgi:hypothetical protein